MLTVLAWALDLPRDLRTTQITALRIQARWPHSECVPLEDTRTAAASSSKQNCPCGSALRLEVPGPCLQPALTSWEGFGNWLSSCLGCLLSDGANDISLSAKRILWVSEYEGLCCFWNLASLSWREYAETGFVAAMGTSSQEWGLWVGEIA